MTEVYKTVRKHRSWIEDDIDLKLEREPRTTNPFAHLIEVTSDLTPKMRSKYANVLRIAHEQNIHSTSDDSRSRAGVPCEIGIVLRFPRRCLKNGILKLQNASPYQSQGARRGCPGQHLALSVQAAQSAELLSFRSSSLVEGWWGIWSIVADRDQTYSYFVTAHVGRRYEADPSQLRGLCCSGGKPWLLLRRSKNIYRLRTSRMM